MGNRRRRELILSIDFEDWHQLVRRRVGASEWDVRGPALERQTHALLDELDATAARATFFLLGITAHRYPDLVGEIVARGHEIASHGYAHRRVFEQSASELRGDLERSLAIIAELTGRRPLGYRAPAFSITRRTPWAYDVLAELGFAYDSSQYDSPRIPERIRPPRSAPFPVRLASGRILWELPIAATQVRGRPLPVGGGTYWRILPTAVLLRALAAASAAGPPALYLHPYECDPRPLRAGIAADSPLRQHLHARLRELQRNPGRRLVLRRLRAVGHHFQLITCEEAYARLSASKQAGTRALR